MTPMTKSICADIGRCAYDEATASEDTPCPYWNECFGVALIALPNLPPTNPIGGKVTMPQTELLPTIQTAAVLSEDGVYRYELTRRWDDRPAVTWVMLNPSFADAEVDDLTVTKCMGFARRWACGGIKVVNLYALRATYPTALVDHPDPIGPRNSHHLIQAMSTAGFVVAAWGASAPARPWTVDVVMNVAARAPKDLWCLGITKSGAPRHPSRLGYDTRLEPFDGWFDEGQKGTDDD
jgi:hypothetical protein